MTRDEMAQAVAQAAQFEGGTLWMPSPEEQSNIDALNAAAAELRKTCEWAFDEGDWEIACGHRYQFIDGGPKENGQNFCGYCGGTLIEVTGGHSDE